MGIEHPPIPSEQQFLKWLRRSRKQKTSKSIVSRCRRVQAVLKLDWPKRRAKESTWQQITHRIDSEQKKFRFRGKHIDLSISCLQGAVGEYKQFNAGRRR